MTYLTIPVRRHTRSQSWCSPRIDCDIGESARVRLMRVQYKKPQKQSKKSTRKSTEPKNWSCLTFGLLHRFTLNLKVDVSMSKALIIKYERLTKVNKSTVECIDSQCVGKQQKLDGYRQDWLTVSLLCLWNESWTQSVGETPVWSVNPRSATNL